MDLIVKEEAGSRGEGSPGIIWACLREQLSTPCLSGRQKKLASALSFKDSHGVSVSGGPVLTRVFPAPAKGTGPPSPLNLSMLSAKDSVETWPVLAGPDRFSFIVAVVVFLIFSGPFGIGFLEGTLEGCALSPPGRASSCCCQLISGALLCWQPTCTARRQVKRLDAGWTH